VSLKKNINSFLLLLLTSPKILTHDSLNHSKLLNKIKFLFGIVDKALHLIDSYISNRSQFVSVNDTPSNFLTVKHGVPQGSILGPLLFNIYINDIADCFNSSNTHCLLYTDDLCFITFSNCCKDIDYVILRNFRSLFMYCSDNQLFINYNKTKIMYLFNYHSNNIFYNSNKIDIVNNYCYLGYNIDNRLNFNYHVKTISNKISCYYFILSCSYKYLDQRFPTFIRQGLLSISMIRTRPLRAT